MIKLGDVNKNKQYHLINKKKEIEMKKLLMRAISLVAVMLFVVNVSAATYKFTAPAPSGQTLSFEYVVNADTAFVWVTCETQHNSVHYNNASAYPNLSGHVIIPDSVEYNGRMHAVVAIGDLAFARCENLAKITFSKHIKYIGYGAFYNCSEIDTIISPYITAPALNDNNPNWSNGWVFGGNANTGATVVVPCGSIEDYRSVWGNTFNYICEDNCADVNVSETHAICRGSYYDFFGSILTESGIYTHTGTTADGCDSIVNLTLVVNELPTVIINGESTFDIGGSTTLTAEGGVSYIWNDGTTTPSITVDACGTYSVTVTDFNGCSNTTSITVTGVVHDTIVNIVHDTVRVCDTVYLPQYIYDTIYIHDTVFVIESGIHELKIVDAKVYVKSGRIIVDDAGVNMVYLFDSVGRMLATKQGDGETMEFHVPAAGVYMVKIGDGKPHKVVVR